MLTDDAYITCVAARKPGTALFEVYGLLVSARDDKGMM